jgi:hypothetical protein
MHMLLCWSGSVVCAGQSMCWTLGSHRGRLLAWMWQALLLRVGSVLWRGLCSAAPLDLAAQLLV